jgi:hypothetical protein
MKGHYTGKLAVGILLLVFIFSLGNLIFNLENLDIADENMPQFISTTAGGQDVATNSTLTNALRWIYYGFMVFCGIVVVIGAITFTASKDRKKWRRLFIQMAGLMLGIAAIFAFAHFYKDIESTVTGIGTTDILPGGGNITTDDGGQPSEAPDSLRIVLAFGVFAIIFLFVIVTIMAVLNFMRMRSSGLDYSDMEKDSHEMATTIQRTIDALSGGSDIRATVIRCYTDMCGVMARHGVEEQEYLTPREFLKLAVKRLPVPEVQMRALVNVFEEARYSQHRLDEADSKRALSALEAVRKVLVAYSPSQVQGVEKPGV